MAVVGALASGAILPAQTAADSGSVTAFYARWFGSLRQGPEAYASFYATDGMVLPPNMPPAIGRVAIADWLTQAQATTPYATRPEAVSVDEMRFLTPDWVVYRSTLRGQRVPRDGSAPSPFETKYVDLLHRTPGGWEVVSRMWSDNK
jgi:ketosteroid isomerase-like protein